MRAFSPVHGRSKRARYDEPDTGPRASTSRIAEADDRERQLYASSDDDAAAIGQAEDRTDDATAHKDDDEAEVFKINEVAKKPSKTGFAPTHGELLLLLW